jgi:hypothetical protein
MLLAEAKLPAGLSHQFAQILSIWKRVVLLVTLSPRRIIYIADQAFRGQLVPLPIAANEIFFLQHPVARGERFSLRMFERQPTTNGQPYVVQSDAGVCRAVR